MKLSDKLIQSYKNKASIEINREIYNICVGCDEICINYDWTIPRDTQKPLNENVVDAITKYCTRGNLEWEWNLEYSAWCD